MPPILTYDGLFACKLHPILDGSENVADFAPCALAKQTHIFFSKINCGDEIYSHDSWVKEKKKKERKKERRKKEKFHFKA